MWDVIARAIGFLLRAFGGPGMDIAVREAGKAGAADNAVAAHETGAAAARSAIEAREAALADIARRVDDPDFDRAGGLPDDGYRRD